MITYIIMACTACSHICTSMLRGNTQQSPESPAARAHAPACMGCTCHTLMCTVVGMTLGHSKTSLPCSKKPPFGPRNLLFSQTPENKNYELFRIMGTWWCLDMWSWKRWCWRVQQMTRWRRWWKRHIERERVPCWRRWVIFCSSTPLKSRKNYKASTKNSLQGDKYTKQLAS